MVNVQGVLHFVSADVFQSYRIWRSDGSEAGTFAVTDYFEYYPPGNFQVAGGKLYFLAISQHASTSAIWQLDGGIATELPLNGIVLPWRFQYSFGKLYVVGWSEEASQELFAAPLTTGFPAEGDFDEDGDADGNDFLTWQRALGTRNWAVDGNVDGVIDASDLDVWTSQFMPTAGAAAVSTSSKRQPTPTPPSASQVSSTTAIADAVFASGDFTTLFARAEAAPSRMRGYRPPRRG
jgi:hypothetical protein